jgi:hypothetical protein
MFVGGLTQAGIWKKLKASSLMSYTVMFKSKPQDRRRDRRILQT